MTLFLYVGTFFNSKTNFFYFQCQRRVLVRQQKSSCFGIYENLLLSVERFRFSFKVECKLNYLNLSTFSMIFQIYAKFYLPSNFIAMPIINQQKVGVTFFQIYPCFISSLRYKVIKRMIMDSSTKFGEYFSVVNRSPGCNSYAHCLLAKTIQNAFIRSLCYNPST